MSNLNFSLFPLYRIHFSSPVFTLKELVNTLFRSPQQTHLNVLIVINPSEVGTSEVYISEVSEKDVFSHLSSRT